MSMVQPIRLHGPLVLLRFLFPDVRILYRSYLSARAVDEREQARAEIRKQMRSGSFPPPGKVFRSTPFGRMLVDEDSPLAGSRHQQHTQANPTEASSASQSSQRNASRNMSTPSQPNPQSPPKPRPPYTRTDLERDLSQIIGLNTVKETIRDIYSQLLVEQQRIAQGMSSSQAMSLHMVFLGNPGTGKTTIARLIGDMFKQMGVLSSGHFVETDPGGLIAEYTGQTSKLTDEKIQEALGGVLLIDEAYGIIDPDSPHANSFGKDCIRTLIKQMEDRRDDLCVIFTGYTKEMEAFIAANPGMESRIAFRLTFEDYAPHQLMLILQKMCGDRGLSMETEASHYLQSLFAKNRARIGERGNGRWVRNVLESAVRKQSRRLANIANNSKAALQTLTLEDVQTWEAEHNEQRTSSL